MISEFKNLTQEEIDILLKAPALVSVLDASGNEELSSREKEDAIDLAHLKTVTAEPILIPYYKEVEKNFTNYFNQIVEEHLPFDDQKREELKNEINTLNQVIAKLDPFFAKKLHISLSKYTEHVKEADKSMFFNFIFPLPISGFND